jgi:hypothetical protein
MASSSIPVPENQTRGAAAGFRFSKRSTLFWLALIVLLLIASRVMLAPTYLVTFDEANFALSLKKFDPIHHQPQPPGYPLFVGFLKLFGAFVPHVEQLFLVVAVFGSVVALVLLWAVGDRLFGAPTGLIAALLLLFHPAFWFAALTNPVRIFLAAGAVGVAFCLAKALVSGPAVRWYYAGAFVYAVAGGFRPDLLFTLFPLMVYTAWRLRVDIRQGLLSAGLFLVPAAAWMAALVSSVGGVASLVLLLQSYGEKQGSSTSPLLGASLSASLEMAYRATIWTFVGALSWIWCVPLVLRRNQRIFSKRQSEFLLTWLAPGFLFYVLVHVGDPDHPLSIIPVTCLAGAVLLMRLASRHPPHRLPFIVAVAVLLNVFLFFEPINKTAKAASYKDLVYLDNHIEQIVDSMGAFRAQGPVTAVCPSSAPAWRTVSYYFPDVPVLVLESGDSGIPSGNLWSQNHPLPLPMRAGTVELPACGTVVWIDPTSRPFSEPSQTILSSMPDTPITYAKVKPGMLFRFRGIHFETEPRGSCR